MVSPCSVRLPCLILLAASGFGIAVEECSVGEDCGDEETGLAQLRLHRSAKGAVGQVPQQTKGASAQTAMEASLFQGEPSNGPTFTSYDPEFDMLLKGSEVRMLAKRGFAFAHESPTYLQKHDWVAFSSNRISCSSPGDAPCDCWKVPASSGESQFTQLHYINLKTGKVELLPEEVWLKHIAMANGGFPEDGESMFVTSQGLGSSPAGVYKLNVRTAETEPVITNSSFMSAAFNSPNDIVKDPVSGAIIFADPIYGWEQGFRPLPQLGNWLWLYPMKKDSKEERPHDLRMVADGFNRPNGVAFASEKADVLYVSDTGYFPGSNTINNLKFHEVVQNQAFVFDAKGVEEVSTSTDPLAPRTVYAFDVMRDEDKSIVGLGNRRTVLIANDGIPDGIKVDCEGRIYTGQNNGVGIFSAGGQALGVIEIPGGASNFVLVPRGRRTQVILMCETKIYSVFINTKTCVIAR